MCALLSPEILQTVAVKGLLRPQKPAGLLGTGVAMYTHHLNIYCSGGGSRSFLLLL